MNAIRCPQCGMHNQPDDVGFPRCAGCNEELLQCVTCCHYTRMACDDAQGAALFSPHRNAAPECPSFRSRYEVGRSRWMRALPAPIWVSLALLALLTTVTAFIWFIDPDWTILSGSRQQFQIKVELPSPVATAQPLQVRVKLANTAVRRTSRWYLVLDGNFLSRAEMGMPSLPAPEMITHDKATNRYILEYPPLPAGDWREVRLNFTPKQAGDFTLFVRLYSPSYRRCREVEAKVTVVDVDDQVLGQKEGKPHERRRSNNGTPVDARAE